MKLRSLLAVVFLGLFARPMESQNRLPPVTLPDGPVFYNTIDQPRIRVVVLTEGLSHPWGMAFLPNGDMLVTEREGRLRVIRDGVLDPDLIRAGVEGINDPARIEVDLRAGLRMLVSLLHWPHYAPLNCPPNGTFALDELKRSLTSLSF